MNKKPFILAALILLMLTGCAGNPNSGAARNCENGLATAYKELSFSKSKGFAGTVEYTKAASLLTAAKIQFEFGKYPNCIDKVSRARAFISKSKK